MNEIQQLAREWFAVPAVQAGLIVIGALVGVLAAIMGVGGGFIMVPAMIYVIGMPTITAIGVTARWVPPW